MLELEIESIRVRRETQQRAVVLRVKDSDLYLPIFSGSREAGSTGPPSCVPQTRTVRRGPLAASCLPRAPSRGSRAVDRGKLV